MVHHRTKILATSCKLRVELVWLMGLITLFHQSKIWMLLSPRGINPELEPNQTNLAYPQRKRAWKIDSFSLPQIGQISLPILNLENRRLDISIASLKYFHPKRVILVGRRSFYKFVHLICFSEWSITSLSSQMIL